MNALSGLFGGTGTPTTLESAGLSLILALVLGQGIGAVYMWTFRGLSYSRAYVFTLVTGSVVAAGLMLAIGDSIAAGIGLAGGMGLIRFRTAMRDPRDLIFVLAALGAGIACGLKAWGEAIMTSAVFALAAAVYTWTDFGARERADGLLRLQLPPTPEAETTLAQILARHTRSFALVTLREVAQGRAMQHAYQVRLRGPGDRTSLIQALERIDGSRDVSLLLQEPTVEI
ncbi:MAG: DUF4956 domain-containing protein [Myxococcota bacterium]